MSFLDNLPADADPNNCNFTMADLVASDGQKENAGQKENVNEEPNRTVVVLNQNNRLGTVYKVSLYIHISIQKVQMRVFVG